MKIFSDKKNEIDKHESRIGKYSKCTKHLQEHFNYVFQWFFLSIALRNIFEEKVLKHDLLR